MRIFVAGATGVLGRRLVPLLVSGGHLDGVTAELLTAYVGHVGDGRAEPLGVADRKSVV